MNSTDPEANREAKGQWKPAVNAGGRTQSARAESPGKPSRRATVILAGIGFGLVLVCLFSYLASRPSAEQTAVRPDIFVVTGPLKLTGSFFGVALGEHRIQGEFLDQEWSTLVDSVFFLSDANGTPFRSDLPTSIGVDNVTAQLGNSIAYGVFCSIQTRFVWKTSLQGKIVVFVDNASSSDVLVTADTQSLPRLPAFSHAIITMKKGIHAFESRDADSSEPIDSKRVFLSDYDRGASGEKIEWYLYNVGGRNAYELKSAQYISSSNR